MTSMTVAFVTAQRDRLLGPRQPPASGAELSWGSGRHASS